MALQWIPLPWCSCGSLGIGNSKTSPRDYGAICNFPPQNRSGGDVLSKGCSAGLFVSPNSSCGLGLGTGGMSSVMQLSCWQFPAVGFLQTFWGCAECLVGGSLPSHCLSVQASCCSVAEAFPWQLLLGMLCTQSQASLLAESRFQVLPALHPCSAGDRGLQGMLKTASSFVG